jgi:hypothetical protein
MTAKIVTVGQAATGKVVSTVDSHANAIPAGATVLASSGPKPTPQNGLPFFTPTVPVHVDVSGEVYFYVNNLWIKPDGTVVSDLRAR